MGPKTIANIFEKVPTKNPKYKEIGSPDGYFLEAYKIKSVLSVHAQMVSKYSACIVKENNK